MDLISISLKFEVPGSIVRVTMRLRGSNPEMYVLEISCELTSLISTEAINHHMGRSLVIRRSSRALKLKVA